MTLPNVQRSLHAVFLIGLLTPDGVGHPHDVRAMLREEQAAHHDLLLLNARETKPPGVPHKPTHKVCTRHAHARASCSRRSHADTATVL